MSRLLDNLRLLSAPCEDMTGLISRAMDTKLPFWPRLAYKFHLLYCRACRRYRKQLSFIRRAFRRVAAELATADVPREHGLPAEARQRIGRALHNSAQDEN